MDIFIDGLEIYGYHGVLPEEKTLGQPFAFDLRLASGRRAAGPPPIAWSDTIDYTEVIDVVTEVVTSTSYDLLEKLVCAVGEAVLARFAVDEVWVRASKLRPPIPASLRSVGAAVTMRRQADSSLGSDGGRRRRRRLARPRPATPTHGVLVFVGLGSNQGDSIALLARAVDGLGALPGTTVVACSSLYRTAAVGFEDQPDFLNQVVALRTTLAPAGAPGRRPGARGRGRPGADACAGARGRSTSTSSGTMASTRGDERLALPHPRLEERRFVLEPLAELAPRSACSRAGGRSSRRSRWWSIRPSRVTRSAIGRPRPPSGRERDEG